MQTIAIVNEKGGTGKTSTAVNLAAALGELGKKILLVDLDGQAAASRWVGVEGDTRLADALWAGEGLEPIPEVMPGVDLAPGNGKLDIVAHDLRPTQGGQLRKVLSHVQGYDYVLIDCPPSLGNRLIGNALLASDSAVVPVETSVLPLDGLKILLTTLDDVRIGFGHEINLIGVVAVRYNSRTRISKLILEELKRALPGRVFKQVVRENVRMRECPAAGISILQYASSSSASKDYRGLAREFVERIESDEPVDPCSYAEEHSQTDHWKSIAEQLPLNDGKSGSKRNKSKKKPRAKTGAAEANDAATTAAATPAPETTETTDPSQPAPPQVTVEQNAATQPPPAADETHAAEETPALQDAPLAQAPVEVDSDETAEASPRADTPAERARVQAELEALDQAAEAIRQAEHAEALAELAEQDPPAEPQDETVELAEEDDVDAEVAVEPEPQPGMTAEPTAAAPAEPVAEPVAAAPTVRPTQTGPSEGSPWQQVAQHVPAELPPAQPAEPDGQPSATMGTWPPADGEEPAMTTWPPPEEAGNGEHDEPHKSAWRRFLNRVSTVL